jgi:hypothetical protein
VAVAVALAVEVAVAAAGAPVMETLRGAVMADDAVAVADIEIKTRRSAPTVERWRCTLQQIVSPWKPTRTRNQQIGNDRDRGHTIAMPSEIG